MTNTSKNPITIVKDGTEYRLDTLAYNVSTKSGIGGSMAPLRGASAVVPGRDGSIYTPGKARGEGMIALSMWAQDLDENGMSDGDPYAKWRENMDKLLWLFDTSTKQVEIREYVAGLASPSAALAGNPYRRAFIEVRDAIDPQLLGRVFGEFTVSAVINDTFWESSDTIDESEFLTAGQTEMDNLIANPSTAPIKDGLITVAAIEGHTISNPAIVDIATGHTIELLDTTLLGAAPWVIDSKNWTSEVDGVSVTSATKVSGVHAPRYFGLSPNIATGQSGIRLRCTSTTGAGLAAIFTFEGRAKFH